MKRKLLMTAAICLLAQSSCYVSTNLKVQNRYLPADFSAPVLVVTLQEKVGLHQDHLALIEQDALEALTESGINSVTLLEAVGEENPDSATKLLLREDYRALLKIVIDFWGSRTEVLQEPVAPSVDSIQTDRDSSFYPPGAIDAGQQKAGPTSSYKEVVMAGYLTDLQTNRLVWSGRANARPAVVGRSFLYHRFNRSLEHDELAKRCLKKIARELGRIWPKELES